jgi:hypothetical protein
LDLERRAGQRGQAAVTGRDAQRVVAAVAGGFGLVGKEPIGCPDPRASGQELWEGARNPDA